MEFVRLGIVFIHLIACCVAIGLVLTSDIAMVKRLLDSDAPEDLDQVHLASLQRTVTLALTVLWITGIAIIAFDMRTQGLTYLHNPKLQAKIGIVALLTFNGIALHSMVLPALQKVGSLLDLSFERRMVAIFAGVISAVSWFYAAMLGVGRPLSWKYSLFQILAAYPVLIAGGIATMLFITALAKSRKPLEQQHTEKIAAY
ncbi:MULTISPECIES: hypothetical protein [Burkholderia]|uniref:DUF2214 domain-containing protein n=1 Tax=Burkholderia contaminans TaxID=488447 RepID=A0A6P2WW26_9BURK|nr:MULTISPECIES: hypothetical protein [Burkholderia]OXJ32534.1 hypothetical protein CFB82_19250 [Burkholderia sp. HI2714]VWD01173.1 hypothetical protein BCO71033_01800 [Burkholderia contaminans]